MCVSVCICTLFQPYIDMCTASTKRHVPKIGFIKNNWLREPKSAGRDSFLAASLSDGRSVGGSGARLCSVCAAAQGLTTLWLREIKAQHEDVDQNIHRQQLSFVAERGCYHLFRSLSGSSGRGNLLHFLSPTWVICEQQALPSF